MSNDEDDAEDVNDEAVQSLYMLEYFLQSRGSLYFSEWLCGLDNDTLDYISKELDFLNSVPEHFFTCDLGSLSYAAENRIKDVVNFINAGLAHDACMTVLNGKAADLDVLSEVISKIDPQETEEIFKKVAVIIGALKMCRMGILKFTKNKHCTIEKYNPTWVVTKAGKRFSGTPSAKLKPKK